MSTFSVLWSRMLTEYLREIKYSAMLAQVKINVNSSSESSGF